MFLTFSEFAGIPQLKNTAVLFKLCTLALPGEVGSMNRRENK